MHNKAYWIETLIERCEQWKIMIYSPAVLLYFISETNQYSTFVNIISCNMYIHLSKNMRVMLILVDELFLTFNKNER